MEKMIEFFSNLPQWRIWCLGGVAIAVLAVCLWLFLSKKVNKVNLITTILIGFVLSIGLIFVNIQTVDEFYDVSSVEDYSIGTVTLSIECKTVPEKNEYILQDGMVLKTTETKIYEGDTIYDVFLRVARENKIVFDDDNGYIKGISNIYAGDHGELSGWLYFVNGESVWVASNEYKLKDGDIIEWKYTCQMGEDLE